MTPRRKLLLGCLAMALAMVGECLLGFGIFGMTNAPPGRNGMAGEKNGS